ETLTCSKGSAPSMNTTLPSGRWAMPWASMSSDSTASEPSGYAGDVLCGTSEDMARLSQGQGVGRRSFLLVLLAGVSWRRFLKADGPGARSPAHLAGVCPGPPPGLVSTPWLAFELCSNREWHLRPDPQPIGPRRAQAHCQENKTRRAKGFWLFTAACPRATL